MKIKVGSIVEVVDGSWSLMISDKGTLEETHGCISRGRLKVVAVDCDLPCDQRHSGAGKRNNIILRSLNDSTVYFTHTRMLKHIHTCNCCPSCGEKI